MQHIRRLKPSEREAAVKLSDFVFRDADHKSMGAAFPQIFLPEHIENSYGYFVGDELVVFMGLVPSTLCVGEKRLSVYSLGSVCTHPDFRGNGYASEVMQAILRDIKETDAAFLLISGDRTLYTRIGSVHFGELYSFELTPSSSNAEVQSDVVIREAEGRDLHRLARLAEARPVRYQQTVQDLDLLIKAEAYASCFKQRHHVLVAEENGEVEAFSIVGVPYMLGESTGQAIEWAGSPKLVKKLLEAAMVKDKLTSMTVKIPWQEKELIEILNDNDYNNKREHNQGTVLVLDGEKLLSQLGVKSDPAISAKSDQELIALLFNPDESSLGTSVEKVPLPLTAGLNYV